MSIARCPVCDDILNIGSELSLYQPVTCSTCLSNLKVVSVEPCELEEANRRPPRSAQGGQHNPSSQGAGRREYRPARPTGSAPIGNNRQQSANPQRDRRPGNPAPPPAFPPNPDKQVDTRRAQKWEKPKETDADVEDEDGYEEFEDKLIRSRGGKGKRGR